MGVCVSHFSFHSLIVHSAQTLQILWVCVCVPVSYTNEIFNYDSCVVRLSCLSVFLIKVPAVCIVFLVLSFFSFFPFIFDSDI